MALTSEVGHARNVSNFNTLISYVETYGALYNPPRQELQLPQLYTILIIAQDKLTCATIQKTAYNNVVNTRKDAFKGLQNLSKSVIATLKACGADPKNISKAEACNRKIQGDNDTIVGAAPQVTLSYEQAVQLFECIISIAKSEPNYKPEDASLTIESLQAMLNWLTQQNTAKTHAFMAIKNVRIERNKVLYHPKTGLIAIAEDIKKYIQTVFGCSSKQFEQVNKIKFKRLKS